MRKLGDNLPRVLETLGREIPNARQIARAAKVRSMWKEAVEDIYKSSAALFLDHTNSVYLMDKDDARTLIVYVDESIFAAELNAQRELFKLKFLNKFNEPVEVFEIHISRGNYKNFHPYREDGENSSSGVHFSSSKPPKPLEQAELDAVAEQVSSIENPTLKQALFKAIVADKEWKKGQNDKNITQ